MGFSLSQLFSTNTFYILEEDIERKVEIYFGIRITLTQTCRRGTKNKMEEG